MSEPPTSTSTPSAEEMAARLNDALEGWNKAMGLRFLRASSDEVVAEIDIEPRHLQPYGLVHGGVYAGMIETVASVGAALHARKVGQTAVGLENHTSFLKSVREGTLRARALPIARGQSTQVWDGTVLSGEGILVASGRVRMFSLAPGAVIAGQKVEIR